jgi:hypothetical protein
MSINTAMIAISRDIASEGIGKTRKNAQQGYNFRGVDEVMNAFAPLLAKHGVIVRPKFSGRECIERQTKNGGAIFSVTVEGEFTFRHESGDEIVVGPIYGESMDSGDKATNKAMAVAFKYAMFQTFCVPLEGVTGADSDAVTHDVAPRGNPMDGALDGFTPEQVADLREIAESITEAMPDTEKAYGRWIGSNLGTDEKKAVWSFLPSNVRTAVKKVSDSKKEKTQ